MSSIVVAIPVIKDSRKFHLEKGRRWTVVEHILLEALAKQDWSIKDLTDASSLPRRVVLEVVIRLMRVGWVELRSQAKGVVFSSTPRGRVYATREELPPVTRSTSRYMGYVVDLFSGSVFRARDLTTLTEEQWKQRRLQSTWAELPSHLDQRNALPDIRILADKLLESDEHLTRVEVQDWRPRRLVALMQVRNGQIDGGLNDIIAEDLKQAILAAANSTSRNMPPVFARPKMDGAFKNRVSYADHPISFRNDDLVMGGDGHRDVIRQAVSKTRHRLILHSTFIRADKIDEFMEWFQQPVQKGAIVDILWGQSREKNGVNDTRQAALALKEAIAQKGLQDRIRIHTSSTRSHSKLILHDTGDPSRFQAVIGSCNWLYSDFTSFDVSIRLRDPHIVADVAFEFTELARPRDGQIPELSVELARLGRNLLSMPQPVSSRAKARLVAAPEHAGIFTDVRESARDRVLLLSHRLDAAAKPAVIKLSSTGQAGGASRLDAIYERADSITPEVAQEFEIWAKSHGVVLKQRAKSHGKVLAWDADNLLVTSLNILSADPDEREPRQEIGVLVSAPNAARSIYEALETDIQNEVTNDV